MARFLTEQPSRAKTRIMKMTVSFLQRAKRAARRAFLGLPASVPATYLVDCPALAHGEASRHAPGRPFSGGPARSSPLTLYHRSASPDSMQVCIALNYKNLPFEKVLVDSKDRSGLDRVSGQPFAPVLSHNGSVVSDSGAILRYLEANFDGTPPLFSTDQATLNEIQRWERLGRNELKECVASLLRNFLSASPDMEELESASERFYEITGKFEERLGDSPWLVEDRITAADVSTAPAVCYGMLLPSFSALRSLGESIAERLKLGVERARTEEWMLRVMAYDR